MTTYTFSPIDDPLGTASIASGINDLDQVVGVYADSSDVLHGFLYSGGTYTPLNAPGATMGTLAFDINNLGQIVGYYTDSNSTEHGFLFSSSTFTYNTLNDPLATGGTEAHGINNSGQVVGQYSNSSGDHGFLYTSSGSSYFTLNDPLGTNGTYANDINDAGQIVGYYTDSSGNQHGFLYNAGAYTTLDGPSGAGLAIALGINDLGQVVGYYVDSSGSLAAHGFLYSGGIYTTFELNGLFPIFGMMRINDAGQIVSGYQDSNSADHGFLATPPTATTYTFSTLSTLNAPSGATDIIAYGINDGGQIVGGYTDSSGADQGFLYTKSGGTYTTLNVGTFRTAPFDINDAGQIVGYYTDNNSTHHGFLYTAGVHTFIYITLDDPLGTGGTDAYGINDAGQIVGDYFDSSGVKHGFLYTAGADPYTTLDNPLGTKGTEAHGINDFGQIVGDYVDSSGTVHGFLYSGGTFTTLDGPSGTNIAFATGINDAGQVVGYYTDSNGALHGFLYSGGTYTTLDDPLGTSFSGALGINNAGQIAGVYRDSSEHGFLANPSPTTITPPTSVQQEVLGLYAALYNRAADFFGYSYWVGIDGQQSDSGGVTVANANTTAVTLKDAGVLGQAFVNTQNTFFNQTYGSLTDNAFVDALYVNIGGNAGDPGGVAYWQNLLQQAEAGGESVQAARAGLAGQFVHDLIGINLAAVTGLTPDQLLAAEQRQEGVNNKIAVSLAYLNASQQPGGSILNAHSVGDVAFNASVTVMQGVTSDPTTVLAAVIGINAAVAHHDLTLI